MTEASTAAPPVSSNPLDSMRISPLAILIGLVGGLAGGLLLARLSPGSVDAVTGWLDPIGALWLRALQMTIVPLVVSLLITGIVTSVAAAKAGRIAGWSIGFFFAMLWGGAIIAAFLTPALLQMFPIDAVDGASMFVEGAGAEAVGPVPPFSEFIKAMVPTNPINAAANDAILPLIVFTVVFALAITRLQPVARDQLTALFTAIGDAMLVIIGWVLALAPVGVAALGFVVAARTGAGAIGVFLHYILIVSSVGVVVWALGYPIAVIGGRRRLVDFARAVLPAQAVAISTQSSLASLPAMLRGAKVLGVPDTTSDVTLPLAVALFRSTGPAMNLAVVIYVAYLTGVELTPTTLAIGVAVAATTTLGAVSLPGSISFISSCAPIALAMGVPIEPLALLVAVETLPDIIRTLGNVTNDTAAVVTVDARAGAGETAPAQG
jgi:proton glutamate symport protein